VDVVEVYDAFTINTILFLEDLGFSVKEEALVHGNGEVLAAEVTALLGGAATV
jgi:acetyl-CoA acetyltransferase